MNTAYSNHHHCRQLARRLMLLVTIKLKGFIAILCYHTQLRQISDDHVPTQAWFSQPYEM